jgi:hypothetical protein
MNNTFDSMTGCLSLRFLPSTSREAAVSYCSELDISINLCSLIPSPYRRLLRSGALTDHLARSELLTDPEMTDIAVSDLMKQKQRLVSTEKW